MAGDRQRLHLLEWNSAAGMSAAAPESSRRPAGPRQQHRHARAPRPLPARPRPRLPRRFRLSAPAPAQLAQVPRRPHPLRQPATRPPPAIARRTSACGAPPPPEPRPASARRPTTSPATRSFTRSNSRVATSFLAGTSAGRGTPARSRTCAHRPPTSTRNARFQKRRILQNSGLHHVRLRDAEVLVGGLERGVVEKRDLHG